MDYRNYLSGLSAICALLLSFSQPAHANPHAVTAVAVAPYQTVNFLSLMNHIVDNSHLLLGEVSRLAIDQAALLQSPGYGEIFEGRGQGFRPVVDPRDPRNRIANQPGHLNLPSQWGWNREAFLRHPKKSTVIPFLEMNKAALTMYDLLTAPILFNAAGPIPYAAAQSTHEQFKRLDLLYQNMYTALHLLHQGISNIYLSQAGPVINLRLIQHRLGAIQWYFQNLRALMHQLRHHALFAPFAVGPCFECNHAQPTFNANTLAWGGLNYPISPNVAIGTGTPSVANAGTYYPDPNSAPQGQGVPHQAGGEAWDYNFDNYTYQGTYNQQYDQNMDPNIALQGGGGQNGFDPRFGQQQQQQAQFGNAGGVDPYAGQQFQQQQQQQFGNAGGIDPYAGQQFQQPQFGGAGAGQQQFQQPQGGYPGQAPYGQQQQQLPGQAPYGQQQQFPGQDSLSQPGFPNGGFSQQTGATQSGFPQQLQQQQQNFQGFPPQRFQTPGLNNRPTGAPGPFDPRRGTFPFGPVVPNPRG